MAILQQAFPKISMPLVDAKGCLTQTWYQWFQAMFNRTGGAVGASVNDAILLGAIAGDGPVSAAGNELDALLFGEGPTQQVDLLGAVLALGGDVNVTQKLRGSQYINVSASGVISAVVGTTGDVLARLATVQTFNPPASATDIGSISFHRNANYVGGTPGFVNSAIRADTIVGASVTAFEWTITGTVVSNASSGEHVGVYGQATANASAAVWGIVAEAVGNFPGGTVVGIETSARRTVAGKAVGIDVADHGNMDIAVRVPQGVPALVNASNETCFIRFPSTGVIELNGSFYSLIGPGYQYSPLGNPLATLGTCTVQAPAVSNTTREYLAGFHFDVSTGAGGAGNAKDKVALASSIVGNAGCGDIWALYPIQVLSPGSGSYNSLICEMDLNNNVGNRGDVGGSGGLSAPVAYGLAITGAGSFRSTSAMLVSGPGGSPIWNRGITFVNNSISQATIQDFTNSATCIDIQGAHGIGIDLSSATISSAAMVIPNGISINSYTAFGVPMRLLYMDGVNNVNIGQLFASTNVIMWGSTLPGLDNSYTCGGSSNRWSEVWAVNGTIQTSDVRQKKDIEKLPSGMLEFVRNINPVRFKWKESGDLRTHWGFIAQDIKREMQDRMLEFGGLVESEHSLALRPDQMIPILWKAFQELLEEVEYER